MAFRYHQFLVHGHYHGAHRAAYNLPDTLGTFLPVEQGMVEMLEKDQYIGKYDLNNQDMVDKLRLRYDEAILQQDRNLANVIRLLIKKGIYKYSMIIITADHGQNFSNGYSAHCTPLLSYSDVYLPLLNIHTNLLENALLILCPQ